MQKLITIDEYINNFSGDTQIKLKEIRKTVKELVPEAAEKIAYGVPTFTYHGNLVHFAAYEHHIGLYPGSDPIVQFQKELEPYETAKGTIRFPIDKPLPLKLIKNIVLTCVERNEQRKRKK